MKFSLKQIVKICLIILCVSLSAAAQNALAGFEKSINEGNYAAVEKDLFSYVVANPKDAKGFALLAKLRLKQNRLNEAKSLANKALTLDANSVSAKMTLALAHFQAGESEQARTILNEISVSGISDNAIRLELAENFLIVGDCPNALNLTEKLPLKIKNSDALAVRANCYWQTGDKTNFDALIPIAKTSARQNPSAVLRFAEVLDKAGMHKETAELMRLIVIAAPKNAAAILLLAKSEILLKDLPNAKKHIALAEKLEPDSSELLFVKSLLESEQGNGETAVELLEKSLAQDPNNIQILGQFVITAMRANYTSKAVRAAERLMQLQPENLDFLYLYGAASLQNNNIANAETALTKFFENRPNDVRGCVALGLVFAAQPEKIEIARNQMQKCLTINPNNFEAAYQLGLSYKAAGDVNKSIEYFEQTISLFPDYAAALRDLGAAYLQTGAEAKARVVLEKSVALEPNDSETHFQLSRLYNLIGERELAKKHLEIFQKLRNPKKEGM